jgi:hypothetical protein
MAVEGKRPPLAERLGAARAVVPATKDTWVLWLGSKPNRLLWWLSARIPIVR